MTKPAKLTTEAIKFRLGRITRWDYPTVRDYIDSFIPGWMSCIPVMKRLSKVKLKNDEEWEHKGLNHIDNYDCPIPFKEMTYPCWVREILIGKEWIITPDPDPTVVALVYTNEDDTEILHLCFEGFHG